MKSYYGRDVQAAMTAARREMGAEAMLVDSRKAQPESRHLGECEVVVAMDVPAEEHPAGHAPSAAAGVARPAQPPYGHLALEVAEMRKQMERIAATVTRSSFNFPVQALSDPELMAMFASLVEADLDPNLAHSIISRIRSEGVPAKADRLRLAMNAELAGRFTTDSQLGTGSAGPRIAAFVGPCGTGKTSMLVKLAARFGLATRRPTVILSLDTYRVAASEQLRSYAALLGIRFQVIEGTRALGQAIEELQQKDLILVDTPGHGPHDLAASEELAGFISSRADIDVHLVLNAAMRSADLSRVVDRFEMFRPAKLAFTRVDETVCFGPFVNESVRTGKPVSFLSGGQRVPEDLEPATKDRIIDLVLSPGSV
jgi:flagellar biosynthesis protein FlhF